MQQQVDARGLHRMSGQCLHEFHGVLPGTSQFGYFGFQITEDMSFGLNISTYSEKLRGTLLNINTK